MLTHLCGLNRRRRLRWLGYAPLGAGHIRGLGRLRRLQVRTYADRYEALRWLGDAPGLALAVDLSGGVSKTWGRLLPLPG